jgi:hypothetical protein
VPLLDLDLGRYLGGESHFMAIYDMETSALVRILTPPKEEEVHTYSSSISPPFTIVYYLVWYERKNKVYSHIF